MRKILVAGLTSLLLTGCGTSTIENSINYAINKDSVKVRKVEYTGKIVNLYEVNYYYKATIQTEKGERLTVPVLLEEFSYLGIGDEIEVEVTYVSSKNDEYSGDEVLVESKIISNKSYDHRKLNK